MARPLVALSNYPANQAQECVSTIIFSQDGPFGLYRLGRRCFGASRCGRCRCHEALLQALRSCERCVDTRSLVAVACSAHTLVDRPDDSTSHCIEGAAKSKTEHVAILSGGCNQCEVHGILHGIWHVKYRTHGAQSPPVLARLSDMQADARDTAKKLSPSTTTTR